MIILTASNNIARLNNLFERYSYDSDTKKSSLQVIRNMSAILQEKQSLPRSHFRVQENPFVICNYLWRWN